MLLKGNNNMKKQNAGPLTIVNDVKSFTAEGSGKWDYPKFLNTVKERHKVIDGQKVIFFNTKKINDVIKSYYIETPDKKFNDLKYAGAQFGKMLKSHGLSRVKSDTGLIGFKLGKNFHVSK